MAELNTALHSAAANGNVETIRRLIKDGADVNALDDSGTTPLIYALVFGYKEAIIELLECGADPYVEDPVGRNAFDRGANRDFRGEWGNLAEYYETYYKPSI